MSSTGGAQDDSAPVQSARRKITAIFRDEDFWLPDVAQEDEEEIANNGREILNLLREFPVLASEKYPLVDRDDALIYPLVYFIWNNLGADILDEVLALYPAVAEDPMRDYFPLNHYLERLYRPGVLLSDETLIWLLAHKSTTSIELEIEIGFWFADLIRRCQERGTHLSLPVVEAFLLKMDSTLSYNGPLEAILTAGYDKEILDVVIRKYANTKHPTASFEGDWTLDTKLADMLQCYLPQFERIDFEPTRWTKEGWVSILTAVQKCEQKVRVKFTVSPGWLVSDPEILSRMLKLLQEKPKDMAVRLEINGEEREGDSDSAAFLDKLLELLRGLHFGKLDSVTLKRFVDLPQQQLLELVEFVDSLEINQSQVARDSVSSRSQPTSLDPDALIASQQLWNMIRLITGSRPCTIQTTYGMDGQKRVLRKVFINLRGVQLDDSFQDITPLVLALLRCVSLTNIFLSCGIDRGTSTLDSFPKLAIQPLCGALKSNRKIESIFMAGVHVESGCSQEIPSKLLSALKKGNSNLRVLTIWNEHLAYASHSGTPNLSRHGAAPHADYETAQEIDLFLWLNQCGRQKLRCERVKVADLVPVLLKTKKKKDSKVIRKLRHLRPYMDESTPTEVPNDVQYLSSVYEDLKESVNDWGKAAANCLAQHAFHTAAIYELLRECPSLWCDSLNGKTSSPEAKKKRTRDGEFDHDGHVPAKKGRVSASVHGSN